MSAAPVAQAQVAGTACEPGSSWHAICASDSLHEGGDGVRFAWRDPRAPSAGRAGFLVRFDGAARAFVNECGHIPVELDWQAGRFFDDSGLYLMCATHGAVYDPTDGRCQGGPCRGRGLQRITCIEADGWIWVSSASES